MLHLLQKFMPSLVTLALGGGLTLLAWDFTRSVEQHELHRRFADDVTQSVTAIEARFSAYRQVLRGGVALFGTTGDVSRADWRTYVESLGVNERYPGILGIGFAQQLQHAQLPEHIASVRQQGYPHYQVHPLDERRPPSAIVYLEPFNAMNQRAFGYDMYSEPTRRAAMARARDTGNSALSGRVTLLQESGQDPQAGILLYLPVYQRGAPLDNIEQRRQALLGWVYSPFRMNDLMRGIMGTRWQHLGMRIYDGDGQQESNLMYDSGGKPAAKADFQQSVQLNLAGRRWTIALDAQPGFVLGGYSTPNVLLLAGFLLTALLALLAYMLRTAEVRSGSLARDMSKAYRSSEKRQRAILENTADGILTIDERGIVRSFNKAAETMFGYYAHEVIGHSVSMLMPARFRGMHGQHISSMETNATYRQLGVRREIVGRRRNGEEFPVWLAVNRIPGIGSCEYVGSVSDLTERKKTLADLQHLANHDALTNLPNRALLSDRIGQAIQVARRKNSNLAVVMLDLDHFKRINDSLGHQVGDDLLKHVAQRLTASVRAIDTVARMGGDEFVLVLADIDSRADVAQLMDKLLKALSQPVPVGGHDMIVTPSIGVSMYPGDGEDSHNLLKNADAAMYRAKAAGRGVCRFFDAGMLRQNQQRLATETALRRALERQELSLEYQPQVDIVSGCLTGCEALLRWTHPELGRVPPDRFVPVAEEMGLICAIGEWVLKTACVEARRMQQRTGLPLRMAVNISPQQFFHTDVAALIEKTLRETGLAADSLEVEITEGVLLENSEDTINMLRRIRALGVSVAVDDFGTGYSSLSYLTRFPIDKLKIDQSFVRDITEDANDAAVTSAIIVMAHALQLRVVAEGVETCEQHQFLAERNCNIAQGYYFGRPMPLSSFLAAADGFARPQTPVIASSVAPSALH